MKNQISGSDVIQIHDYVLPEIHNPKSLPAWLMDDIQGYAVFILNNEGRVSYWNQGAGRLIGFTAEEIIGQHFSRLYDSREMQLHKMSRFCLGIAAKQGFYENKGWWVRHGAPNFLAQVIIMRLANDGGGFVVMVWDISKKMEAAAEANGYYPTSPLDD
jgi:PAS domain S-box-containing protein